MSLYKTFPPRWSHIRVPLSSRAAARAAIALYAPCTRRGFAVQRAAWLLVSGAGPRALPGPAAPWSPPVEADTWKALTAAWTELLGPYDSYAVYQRAQQGRSGFAVLLLRAGRPLAFIRVRPTSNSLSREHDVLQSLDARAELGFWHPRPLGVRTAGGWHSLITSPLPPVIHRPVIRADVAGITSAISEALAPSLPRPPGTPPHWEPMHGDFTPWNVRQVRKAVAVVDWEDAAWAPPGADAVLYAATEAALRRRSPNAGNAEAAAFWLEHVQGRRSEAHEAEFHQRLVAALQRAATDR